MQESMKLCGRSGEVIVGLCMGAGKDRMQTGDVYLQEVVVGDVEWRLG